MNSNVVCSSVGKTLLRITPVTVFIRASGTLMFLILTKFWKKITCYLTKGGGIFHHLWVAIGLHRPWVLVTVCMKINIMWLPTFSGVR
jgi:hypothetical protein